MKLLPGWKLKGRWWRKANALRRCTMAFPFAFDFAAVADGHQVSPHSCLPAVSESLWSCVNFRSQFAALRWACPKRIWMPSGNNRNRMQIPAAVLCVNEVFAWYAYASCFVALPLPTCYIYSHYAYALVLSEILNKHLHISQLAGICLSPLLLFPLFRQRASPLHTPCCSAEGKIEIGRNKLTLIAQSRRICRPLRSKKVKQNTKLRGVRWAARVVRGEEVTGYLWICVHRIH